MNPRKITGIAVAALVAALLAAGAALAANGNGRAVRGVLYQFRGELTAASSTQVSLSIQGGNRIALRKLLGQSVDQSFTVGAQTEFLKWANGVPSVVQPGDLAAGDWVNVNVRAPRGASLAEVEAAAAGVVGDYGAQPTRPGQPLYLFRGKLASATSSSVTLDVALGNARALRLLIGQSGEQTFATGPQTIFLLWQGKVPTVISAAQLKPGDVVTVRIRAAARSTLAQVEATPAVHVGDHEPAAGLSATASAAASA